MKYLSIVTAANNKDNNRGDFLTRMQTSLDSIFSSAARVNLNADMTIVDWGTPPENPGLHHVIDFTKSRMPVKIIQVPEQFIKKNVPNPHNIPFMDSWARNVGIRRSTGRFVLTINSDSMYNLPLMDFLAQEELCERCFYRVNRHDMRNGQVYQVQSVTPHSFNGLHFNSAGEFILMAQDKYREIRGFPELEYWGGTDGQVVFMAHQAGLKQVILPYPIRHQDHPRNAHYSPEWDDAKPYAFKNGENWGFPKEVFDTVEIGGRYV